MLTVLDSGRPRDYYVSSQPNSQIWPRLTHPSATSDVTETEVIGVIGVIEASDDDRDRLTLALVAHAVSPRLIPIHLAVITERESVKTTIPAEGTTGNGTAQNVVTVETVGIVGIVGIVVTVVTVGIAVVVTSMTGLLAGICLTTDAVEAEAIAVIAGVIVNVETGVKKESASASAAPRPLGGKSLPQT